MAARAQEGDAVPSTTPVEQAAQPGAPVTVTEVKAPEVKWILSASSGAMVRTNDDREPFVALGIGRRIGRGYVRLSGTRYRSTFRQIDAVMPSRFAVASLSGGGTFGLWFVDAYASYGRQTYGGVTTQLGTRPSQVGSGSPVMGTGVSGGRFIDLGHGFWLTPSIGVQLSKNRALRQRSEGRLPVDYETRERAITGTATVRLDRYFGKNSEHIAGVSISRVETSNGAVTLSSQGGASLASFSVPDGWVVAGASASFRLTPRLWLDASATRTSGAQAGDVTVPLLGLRLGF